MRMRHTTRKRQCVTRNEVMDPIADPRCDRPFEKNDLLVLARVDVQREGDAERFLGLPRAETPVALGRTYAHDDLRAGEPHARSRQSRRSVDAP